MNFSRGIKRVGLVLTGLTVSGWLWGAPLKVGQKAPDFTLPNENGQPVRLANYFGKKNVVLAFYVLAFTPG